MPTIKLASAVAALCFMPCAASAAVATVYDTEAAYFAVSSATDRLLFDFEEPAFPSAAGGIGPVIGVIAGVDFQASVFEPGAPPVSGEQALTGINDTFGQALIDLTGATFDVFGFSLYGGDLVGDEIIRIGVGFGDGDFQSFDVDLSGEADLTPIFFGLTSGTDTITQITLQGLRASGSRAPFWIDDFSVLLNPADEVVPLPGAIAFFATGMAGMAALRRRAKV